MFRTVAKPLQAHPLSAAAADRDPQTLQESGLCHPLTRLFVAAERTKFCWTHNAASQPTNCRWPRTTTVPLITPSWRPFRFFAMASSLIVLTISFCWNRLRTSHGSFDCSLPLCRDAGRFNTRSYFMLARMVRGDSRGAGRTIHQDELCHSRLLGAFWHNGHALDVSKGQEACPP